MSIRELIPWTRNQDLVPELFRDERSSPFLTLHREMNRLLEEAFRGFALSPLAGQRAGFINPAWPKLEVAETDKQITEMKSETEDKERQFSERFYGRFERRIPVGMDIDESKIEAAFKNGVRKVTLPKTERAQSKAKRIATTHRPNTDA